jgi:hypothetical protein
MNCQEFAQVLDEQELHQLPAVARGAAEAHLAACPDCSSDHEVHGRLAALRIPAVSTARVASWRALGVSGAVDGGRRQRMRNRYAVIGALAVMAAAAAVLGLRREDPPAQAVEVVAEDSPSPLLGDTVVPASLVAEEVVQVMAEPVRITGEPVQPAPRPFTVLVQPLEYGTEDGAVRNAAEDFHTALLDGLRAIPGLQMVGPDPGIDPASRQTDFRISAVAQTAKANQQGVQWEVMLRLHVLQEDSRRIQPFRVGGMLKGEECRAGDSAGGCGGAALAPAITDLLRGMMLPASPSIEGKFVAQVQDPALSPAERIRALEVLNCHRIVAGSTCPRRGQLGADVIGAALAMISGPGDAAVRGGFVQALRGQSHSDLVQPLIEIAHRETEDSLRLEAVTSLVEDFNTDAAARSALELVARDDASPLVRKVAARAVSGTAAWDEYAIATVRDTTLPVAQRLAPLEWMAGTRARGQLPVLMGQLLDGTGAHVMLADLLSAAQKDSKGTGSTTTLLNVLRDSRHSTAVDFWLAMFERNPESTVLSGLYRHRAEGRVRKRLEEIAATHPDAKLRETAASLLESPQT